jgi:hypothetical protein
MLPPKRYQITVGAIGQITGETGEEPAPAGKRMRVEDTTDGGERLILQVDFYDEAAAVPAEVRRKLVMEFLRLVHRS